MSTGKAVMLAWSPSDDPRVDKIERYLNDPGVTSIGRITSAQRLPEPANHQARTQKVLVADRGHQQ